VSGAAEHEGRHAAAGILTGVVLTEAALTTGGGGYVQPEWDLAGPEALRAHTLMILAGRLGDDGWPPEWPSKTAATRDERQLAVLAEALELDAAGWCRLVIEIWRLASTRAFRLLELGVATALVAQGRLSGADLARIQQIVWEVMR
jgi:hypothetical protein